MPSISVRHILPNGNSLVIVIPKEWLRFWELKKGDEVEVIYNGIMVVIPSNHPKKKEIRRKVKEALL